ncbi:tRNA glutamyl-Q(34) synthetase GluQRS [Polycladidibacter hongkongensis]|uniref:tRNA glutamyl-Q(34) synthetase GluQRS n=1 Tax=Polycladidibacter hongkongensis TaxID=1647556 RepID=UPI0008344757|nr:tRNA glutamyl-Q(34) synthetase GluQRS [Pseudovibrio hongkongensis]
MNQACLRFAPSPNGQLHLGHAYSALLNEHMANRLAAKLLLRLEDIDTTRCTPALQQQMLEDLEWLGIRWHEAPQKQSEHFPRYQQALAQLEAKGLLYRAYLTRSQIKTYISQQQDWPRDPDGAPLYPGSAFGEREAKDTRNAPYALRLNMQAALSTLQNQGIDWQELTAPDAKEAERIKANPAAWGDIILARKDTPTSYHLSVVVDDAAQGISHVVRGQDLYHATSVHRLLQQLLGLPAPLYHHHKLLTDDSGDKLAKSASSISLRTLREQGTTPADIRRKLGFAH